MKKMIIRILFQYRNIEKFTTNVSVPRNSAKNSRKISDSVRIDDKRFNVFSIFHFRKKKFLSDYDFNRYDYNDKMACDVHTQCCGKHGFFLFYGHKYKMISSRITIFITYRIHRYLQKKKKKIEKINPF